MYQPSSTFGAHYARSFGMLCITTLLPGGDKGVQLKSNYLKMWVTAKMWGRVLDCLSRFRLIVAWCKSLSHNWIWKSVSTLHSTAIKWLLNVCITLSVLFAIWLLGGTDWYLMFMVVIVIFEAVDALLSMKWKPRWIPQLFKYSVKYLKDLIISLSLLFFVSVVSMELHSYTYIT